MNWIIIGLNTLVFLFELSLTEPQIKALFETYGVVPLHFSGSPEPLPLTAYFPFLSSMFLHGGWAHYLGNMWTLFIFGDNVEDRMGPARYLVFYLLSGLGAGILHYYLNILSDMPAIGASGAISGVMAAYMVMFPHSRIIFIFPIFIFPFFFELSAFFYIGAWFFGQLLSGTSFLMAGSDASSIAFWAHVGGFLTGLALYRFFITKKDSAPPDDDPSLLYENPFQDHYRRLHW